MPIDTDLEIEFLEASRTDAGQARERTLDFYMIRVARPAGTSPAGTMLCQAQLSCGGASHVSPIWWKASPLGKAKKPMGS